MLNAIELVRAATEPVTSVATWSDVVRAIPTKEQYAAKIRARNGAVRLPVMYSYGADGPRYTVGPNAVIMVIGKNCHAKVLGSIDHVRVEFRRGPYNGGVGPAPVQIGKPAYFKFADYRNARELLTAVLAEFINRTGTGKKKATAAAEPANDVFQHAVSALQVLTGSKFYIEDDRNLEWWLNRVVLVGPGHLTLEFDHSFGPDSPKWVITYSVTTYTHGDLVEIEISSPADARRGRNTPRKRTQRLPVPSTGPALVKLVLNHVAVDLHAAAVFRNGKLQHLPVTAAAEPPARRDIDAMIRDFFGSLRRLQVTTHGKTVILSEDPQFTYKAQATLSDTESVYSIYPHYAHNHASKYGGLVIQQVRDAGGRLVSADAEDAPYRVIDRAQSTRDLANQIVRAVLALEIGTTAHAATEPAATTGAVGAFCALVKSTLRLRTLTAQGLEIKVHADAHGLPTLPNRAWIHFECPDGSKYILRALGYDPNEPSFVSLSKLNEDGTDWAPVKYSKQFLWATSAADLLKQVLTHIVHVEKQNS